MKIAFDSLIPISFRFDAVKTNVGRLKYFVVLAFPLSAFAAFASSGILTLLPAILLFVVVPILELIIKPDHTNFDDNEKDARANTLFFDWFLYALIPILLAVLLAFLFSISAEKCP